MNLSVEDFKDGFFCLAKFCRNELLQKMISSLNKAQVDLLLKHLDQISLLSQDSTENEEGTNTDFLNLMNLYESLTIPLRLTILVEILDNIRACDSDDLVEIIDNRLDELNNFDGVGETLGSDEELDEDIEDHEAASDDDIVMVDPTVSLSEDNEADLDSSGSIVSGGLNTSANDLKPKLHIPPTHFLHSSLQLQTDEEEETRFCDLCEKYVKKKGWYKHMNTVHSTQRFSCTLCPNSKFKAKKYWKAHMRNIHKDLNIQFPDGRSSGASTFGLLGPGLRCGQCFMAFTSVDQLKHHSDTVHKNSDENGDAIEHHSEVDDDDFEEVSEVSAIPTANIEASIKCKSCTMTFKTTAELSVHDQAVHNAEYAQCPYCLIMTKSLRNHIKFVHMKKFQCQLCHKSFSANAKLTRHLESHLRGTNRIHHPGSEQIIPADQLSQIILPRDRPKNITCDLCGYKCVSTWKLNRHMNAHRKGTNRFSLH